MLRLFKLQPLYWLLLILAITLLTVWGTRTIDMYRELGLRIQGDTRQGGMSLYRAGEYQLRYLIRSIQLEFLMALREDEPDALPRVHLFVQEADLAELDSALPASGREYKDGRLYDGDDFKAVKVRYRGDFASHWGYFKRSFRVKTKRDELFHGVRKFNLIIPKTASLYGNHAGYEMAHLLGLLAPRSQMVNLNLNGRHRGVHLLVEQITETTLRAASRLPGDIYSGDELYGVDTWYGVELPMFETAGVWQKVAINNHYPESHDAPLRQLLLALKTRDAAQLESLLDLTAFARLNLWEQLANAHHLDNEHNWRLYYDPGRGRFFPILWDGMPWAEFWLAPDWKESFEVPEKIIASTIMERLHEQPAFLEAKQQVFTDFLYSDKPDELLGLIKDLNQTMKGAALTDTAILNEKLRWVTTDESIAAMQDNVILVEKIIDGLRNLYPQTETTRAQLSYRESATELWEGEIHLTENTTITSPLRIEAGTRVKLDADVSLFINNHVVIDGTAVQPVIFASANDAPFGTVVIEGMATKGSRLTGFKMTNGSGYKDDLRNYSGMLSIHDTDDIVLSHCQLANNQRFDDQLHIVYSTIKIEDCDFTHAPMDAIDLDMSQATITNARFSDNGNDGLDLMGSKVTAAQLSFTDNGDKGISVGENSILTISDSRFTGNEFGIQIKDQSTVSGDALFFEANKVAVDAYAKNWRYGAGGHARLCNSVFIDGTTPPQEQSRFDKNSHLHLTGKACPDITAYAAEALKAFKADIEVSVQP